jgi:UDP-glucuronate 4-epimerase
MVKARYRRALVTGCAGFIGSHLTERLLDDGCEVIGIDCFTDYYARELKEGNLERARESPNFTLVEADLSVDPLIMALEGVDVVFHLAAQPGVRGSFGDGFARYLRHNLLATQRLLEAVATTGPERPVVYASSSSVYGNAPHFPVRERERRSPISPYGLTKLATEELAGVYGRSHGIAAVGLRYFTVYGPRQRPDMAFTKFLGAALDRRPVTVLGDGSQIREFTYVSDAVEATIAAARRGDPGCYYNVGGGSQVGLLDAISMIGELLGRPIEIEYHSSARGDVRRTSSHGVRAARDLGFEPRVPFEIGLERQVEWALQSLRSAAPVRTAVAV